MFISQFFSGIPCISQEFPVFSAVLENMSISRFFANPVFFFFKFFFL